MVRHGLVDEPSASSHPFDETNYSAAHAHAAAPTAQTPNKVLFIIFIFPTISGIFMLA